MKVTAVIIGYTIRGGIGVPIGIKELFEGGRLNELEGDGCTEYTAADPALVAGVIIAVGVLVDAFDATIGDRRDAEKLADAGAIVVRGGEVKLVDAATIAVLNADGVVGFCGDAVVDTAVVAVPASMRKRS